MTFNIYTKINIRLITGIIGYLKLCKPSFGTPSFLANQHPPLYNSDGIGGIGSTVQGLFNGDKFSNQQSPAYHNYYSPHYRNHFEQNGAIKFGDDETIPNSPYHGYSEYRATNKDIKAQT